MKIITYTRKKGQTRSRWKEIIEARIPMVLTMTALPEHYHVTDWVADWIYSALCKAVYRSVITNELHCMRPVPTSRA
jgi:hypothetical protein